MPRGSKPGTKRGMILHVAPPEPFGVCAAPRTAALRLGTIFAASVAVSRYVNSSHCAGPMVPQNSTARLAVALQKE